MSHIPIPKYDKNRTNDPHSVEDYKAQAPCWVPIVKQINSNECRDAYDKGEKLEPIYEPTRPIIVCNCGNLVGLKNHNVAEDGTVNASWYHKKGTGKHEDPNGCEWHVFVKLADYTGKAYPRLADEDHTSD